MPRTFWIDADSLLGPATQQLRDLANRIDNWDPDGDIKGIREDAHQLLVLATTVSDISKALEFAFPPKDEESSDES